MLPLTQKNEGRVPTGHFEEDSTRPWPAEEAKKPSGRLADRPKMEWRRFRLTVFTYYV